MHFLTRLTRLTILIAPRLFRPAIPHMRSLIQGDAPVLRRRHPVDVLGAQPCALGELSPPHYSVLVMAGWLAGWSRGTPAVLPLRPRSQVKAAWQRALHVAYVLHSQLIRGHGMAEKKNFGRDGGWRLGFGGVWWGLGHAIRHGL